MTYERRIDTPRPEAVALSVALHPHEADSLRTTINQGMTTARDMIDDGVSATRGLLRQVPARAWKIGAMLTAAVASLAIGTYAAFGRDAPSRQRKSATTRRTARRGSVSRARKTA